MGNILGRRSESVTHVPGLELAPPSTVGRDRASVAVTVTVTVAALATTEDTRYDQHFCQHALDVPGLDGDCFR